MKKKHTGASPNLLITFCNMCLRMLLEHPITNWRLGMVWNIHLPVEPSQEDHNSNTSYILQIIYADIYQDVAHDVLKPVLIAGC